MAAAVSCGCRQRCNYVLAGQPSVSFQKFTGFLITLLIWVHGGGDGKTQTGARLFAREHLLSIDSRCQSVNWTKKKIQAGRGEELKIQASPTSYYLLTPKWTTGIRLGKNPGKRRQSLVGHMWLCFLQIHSCFYIINPEPRWASTFEPFPLPSLTVGLSNALCLIFLSVCISLGCIIYLHYSTGW